MRKFICKQCGKDRREYSKRNIPRDICRQCYAESRESILQRIEKLYIPEPMSGCFIWTGALFKSGYGKIKLISSNGFKRAHVVMYELAFGKIPDGLEPDHKCRLRCCINPYHLEPVTHRINILRGVGFGAVNAAKTECKRGIHLQKRIPIVRRSIRIGAAAELVIE